MNYYALVLQVIQNARSRRIELLPTPDGGVAVRTPRGHYLTLRDDLAQIVAVDDFRPTGGTYGDLIPGYTLVGVRDMGVPDWNGVPEGSRKFVSVEYLRKG